MSADPKPASSLTLTVPTALVTAVLTAVVTRFSAPAPDPVTPPFCPTPAQWAAMQSSHNEIRETLARLEKRVELDVSSERTLRNEEVSALARRVARLEREP